MPYFPVLLTGTLALLSASLGANAATHQEFECPRKDYTESALIGAGRSGGFVTCTYAAAGQCAYSTVTSSAELDKLRLAQADALCRTGISPPALADAPTAFPPSRTMTVRCSRFSFLFSDLKNTNLDGRTAQRPVRYALRATTREARS